MKRLFLLTILLMSLAGKGQHTYPANKIFIGINFSPDYSFRNLKNSDGSSSAELTMKNRNEAEVAKFGYTTGLNVRFHFSELAALESGVHFSNRGYETKNQDLVYFPPSPGSPTKAKFNYAYQYIGIPLKARFTFGKDKVRFVSSIGFMTNFLVQVKQTAHYEFSNGEKEELSESSKSGFHRVDISPMMSVGIDYKLNNKMYLLAEPTFRYGAIKTKDAPVAEYLWNAGLNVGFYYAL